MKPKQLRIPGVGMRMIKSAFGVFLGFVIYFLRGCHGTPFYTALSVLWCTRPYNTEAKQMALQRSIGTFIGGFYGLILILSERAFMHHFPELLRYFVISISLIPVLYTTVLLKKKNASYFACVVFLSIVVLHLTDVNPYLFVFNRVLDTLIGIGIALVLSMIRLPRNHQTDILFVSGMDETLVPLNGETLSPYSRIELNRMLDDGAQFTISTMRTPATLVKNLQGIRLKLPVIAMDGAVLYDINDNRYLHKYELPYEDASMIISMIQNHGQHVFSNVLIDDMLAIYYTDFKNEIEEQIYTELRRSPYRNYLHKELPEGKKVIYLMAVDTSGNIQHLYCHMKKLGWTKEYKILQYPSTQYPGYSYIKIYHKDATKANMIEYLKDKIQASKVITFGSIENAYDIVIHDNYNYVVRQLKRLYEPYKFMHKKGNRV